MKACDSFGGFAEHKNVCEKCVTFQAGGDVDTHLLQIGVHLTNPSTRAIIKNLIIRKGFKW